jgi:hypothetical protein
MTLRKEQGILLASGLIAGEGIMGVVIALAAFSQGGTGSGIGTDLGEGASIIGFAALIAILVAGAMRRPEGA